MIATLAAKSTPASVPEAKIGRRAQPVKTLCPRRVPEISRFFGIVVAMYYDDHPPPHFTCDTASIGLF